MNKYWEKIFRTWKMVFGNWKYTVLGLAVAFIFYALNIVFVNWGSFGTYWSVFSLGGFIVNFFNLMVGFVNAVPGHVWSATIGTSLLTGMLVALLTFRFKVLHSGKNLGFWESIGVFLGLFVSGCSSCGIGLIAILGLGTSVAFLPFHGAELGWLAIAVLVFVIMQVSYRFLECKRD